MDGFTLHMMFVIIISAASPKTQPKIYKRVLEVENNDNTEILIILLP